MHAVKAMELTQRLSAKSTTNDFMRLREKHCIKHLRSLRRMVTDQAIFHFDLREVGAHFLSTKVDTSKEQQDKGDVN